MSYSLVAGDLEPDMLVQASADLTGAISVDLEWIKPDGTASTVALIVVSLAAGTAKKAWTAGETDAVGTHRGRMVVTFAGPRGRTFPNDGAWFYWNIYA